MDELSEDARKLIARAMTQDEPPPGAEEESWGMVISRAERSQIAAAVSTVAPAPANATRWIGAVMLLGALAVVVGLGVWVVRSGPPRQTPSPPSPTGSPAPMPSKAAPASHHGAAPTPTPSPAPATPATDARSSAELLDDAEAAITRDAASALGLLEQHAQRFAIDQSERRLALRVRTLCALDRTADAHSEAVAFLERHPASQWTPDVRASCGGR